MQTSCTQTFSLGKKPTTIPRAEGTNKKKCQKHTRLLMCIWACSMNVRIDISIENVYGACYNTALMIFALATEIIYFVI